MTDRIARAALPIRRPVAEVFEAFVGPSMLTRFWLASASARLSAGATVDWEFMVPGAKDTVTVAGFDPDRCLTLTWSDGSTVTFEFEPWGDGGTLLSVRTAPFAADADEELVGTTEGYTLVLCDLKTLLETGRSANLVRDKAASIARQQA